MRRVLPFVIVAVAASAVTAGAIVIPARADEGSDRPSFRERMAEFEACMKEHGFDISGAKTEIRVSPGEATINGKEVDPEKFLEAEKDCGPPFGPGLGPGFGFGIEVLPDLELLPEERRAHAERLRECLAKARRS